MKRILTSVAFLVALLAQLLLARAVDSQPLIFTETGDASHLFGSAQAIPAPLSEEPTVMGEISFFEDCDGYTFATSTSASHYVASVWSQNERFDGGPVPKHSRLFTQLSTGRRNWESAAAGFGQPLVRALVAPGESLGVIDCNNDARYIDAPDGAEVYDPEPKPVPMDYELIVPAIRYVPSVHFLPQEEVYSTLDAEYVLDCTGGGAVDAVYFRYDNPTAGFDPGEVKVVAIRIPRDCFHVGLKAYGNWPLDLVAMLPDGSLLPLGDCSQKRDDDDPTIPDINSSLNFKDFGAVMPSSEGENVCLRHVPDGVDEVVIFIGQTIFFDGQTPRDEADCDTCVRNVDSVGPVRFSDALVMIINPEVSISGATVAGSGANEVTASFDVPAAAQVLGYSLTHIGGTPLWQGQALPQADGGTQADTLFTVTDENAHTEFRHLSSRSYEITLGGLPPGEAEFTLCALGRGTYSDLDVVPGSCLTRTATVPVSNEDEPDDEPPGSAQSFALSVYPNPMSRPGLATVRIAVPTAMAGVVRIAVYDVLGREVALVHDGALAPGEHELRLALTGLATGMYLVRATSDSGIATVRITVVR